MLSKKNKKYFVLICSLFIVFFIAIIGDSSAVEPPKSSSLSTHKIFLTSNTKLDAFVAGNGTTGLTAESAHIIENFTIHTDVSDYGIFIQNIDRYLIIRNCTIFATDIAFSENSGIEIRISSNVIIDNCTISYHEIGIMLLDSHYCSINNSLVFHNLETGVQLIEADHNIVNNNTITNNLGFGIYLKRSHENTISNNIIEENLDLGIYDRGTENIFENNTCDPSTTRPIFNKAWLWVILGVGGAVFFIGGLMFFITWRGR